MREVASLGGGKLSLEETGDVGDRGGGLDGIGLALQLNLTGDALEVTRHLSARRLKARDGVKKLLMVLDDEYRGMEEGRLDEAAEAFIQCRKMTGESMSRHIRRLKQVRRELEEEDENMYVSEKFFSWLLLRKSGLSSEEKSRIRGAAHCSENAKDIAYAMKRLFPGTLHYRPPERGHHPCRRENGPKHEKNAYVVGGGGDRDSKDDRSDPLPSVPEEESADGSEDSSSDESAESESTPLPENEALLQGLTPINVPQGLTPSDVTQGLTPINVSQSLSKLNVQELRALYKTHIKGKPHPADPTQGMTSLQKDQLQQLTLEHGLKIEFASGKKFTKGEMMLQLRQHWEDQCLLALQPNQTASVTAESKLPVPVEKDQDQQLRTRNTKRPENPDWEVIPTMVTSPDEKAIIKIKEAEKQVEDAKKIMEAANTRLAVEKQRAGVP
eukprot:symbB.v1.2.039555.t1/scaffold6645.1/size16507/1